MKRSEVVILALVGGSVIYTNVHHGKVFRDVYESREDCETDWNNIGGVRCEPASDQGANLHGGLRYYGPTYEQGARPPTSASYLSRDRMLIARGGFGRSGARFSGGG